MPYTINVQRVGDLVLLRIIDDEHEVTAPMDDAQARHLAHLLTTVEDRLDMVDIEGGIDS